MAPKQLLLEGPAIEPLLEKVWAEHGPDVTIVKAERVRVGGVAGFFAREQFEVTVEVPDQPPAPPTPAARTAPRAARPPAQPPRRVQPPERSGGLEALLAAAEQADAAPARPAPARPASGGAAAPGPGAARSEDFDAIFGSVAAAPPAPPLRPVGPTRTRPAPVSDDDDPWVDGPAPGASPPPRRPLRGTVATSPPAAQLPAPSTPAPSTPAPSTPEPSPPEPDGRLAGLLAAALDADPDPAPAWSPAAARDRAAEDGPGPRRRTTGDAAPAWTAPWETAGAPVPTGPTATAPDAGDRRATEPSVLEPSVLEPSVLEPSALELPDPAAADPRTAVPVPVSAPAPAPVAAPEARPGSGPAVPGATPSPMSPAPAPGPLPRRVGRSFAPLPGSRPTDADYALQRSAVLRLPDTDPRGGAVPVGALATPPVVTSLGLFPPAPSPGHVEPPHDAGRRRRAGWGHDGPGHDDRGHDGQPDGHHGAPGPHLPPPPDERLPERLAALGVPTPWLWDLPPGRSASLRELSRRIASAGRRPRRSPVQEPVVVVLADLEDALPVAHHLATGMGLDGEDVLVLGRRTHGVAPERCLPSRQDLQDAAEDARAERRALVVVVPAPVGAPPPVRAAVADTLDVLAPDEVWAVVDATRRLEDTAAWLTAVAGERGVDALALTNTEVTSAPAAALALPAPVVLVGDRPASPGSWVCLLAARLAEQDLR